MLPHINWGMYGMLCAGRQVLVIVIMEFMREEDAPETEDGSIK